MEIFDFDRRAQLFSLVVDGFPILRFSPSAEVDGTEVGMFSWKPVTRRGPDWHFEGRNGWGAWSLVVRRGKGGTSLLEVCFGCRLKRKAARVRLVSVAFQAFSATHILTHGRKMGGCESRLLGKSGQASDQSHFWIAITRNDHTLHLSHPLLQKDVSRFSCETAGNRVRKLSADTLFDPCGRKNLQAAPVTLSASAKGHDLLVSWADEQAGGRPLPPIPQESGWNSWDYYRWTITEDEVYKNAELIAADPILSRHIKRIIVDDGWQYCYGEWEPNSLFPSGMKKLAVNLRRMGFTPGLWFAPTIAEPHSRLAQLHPEMLANGAAGIPCLAFSCMERKGFLLDPTHPGVRAWWDEIFRRYAGYGFRYIKLDFLAWTVPGRRFADPKAGPGDLMRSIVEPIREAVGTKSRILGCNFNLEGGIGLVDDVRISSDIHSNWDSVRSNVISLAARFFAHRRFWINDPDFTLCRGEETSNDPHLHQLKPALPFVRPENTSPRHPSGMHYMSSLVDLSAKEAEVLLSLVIISGGAMNLSDNLPRLNEVGLGLLRRTVQAEKGEAAVPIDLFRSKYPSYWVQKLSSGLHRVLLINWSDKSAVLSLDLAALNVPFLELRDFWNDEEVLVKRGKLLVNLAPHACFLGEAKS
jgi:hypothetical protein